MEKHMIKVNVDILADVKKVWDCYTMPEHICKWNFAIDTWHCPTASNDLRKGGKYTARMEAKDGSIGFDFEAIYDEVVEYKKLIYTMSDGRVVEVLFGTEGLNTEVIITFEAEHENTLELQRDGWQAILNNFKAYAES
jgi:uncharacterized protein YndB with AHSA1/START domain